MHLDPAQLISVLVGVVLPILVGLITNSSTQADTKAVLLLAFSGVTSVATEFGQTLTTGSAFDWGTVLVAALATFLTGVGVHFGLLKPVKASAAARAAKHNA